MNNEKEMTSNAGETVVEDGYSRRPWHKPTVVRINISRTLGGGGSSVDGFGGTIPGNPT